jgi:probable phosphoglycerate mutase
VTADRLLLWRHGRTASNAGGRFQGQLDVPLDEVGQVQIKDAAEQLAVELRLGDSGGTADDGPCRILSSDLSRAHDTALALSARLGLPVTTDPRLREISVGWWEGLLHEEVIARDAEGFRAWRAGADIRPGDGETRSEAGVRAETAIREYAAQQEGGVLVVASHGAALRGAVLRLIGVEQWTSTVLAPLRNAHWAQLDRRATGWVLTAYNIGPVQATAAAEG